jgi:exopolyphosphatase/guanosine-5'-triphosphate,3'-diphosphate pyrophosphatase
MSTGKKLAVIDIGTNTCLLLIAEYVNGSLVKLFEKQEIPRLGAGVDKKKNISDDSLFRLLKVLKNYQEISYQYDCSDIIAFGTSALRDAGNRDKILRTIFDKIDLEVKIISGEEEARLSYEGSVFDQKDGNFYTVLDIGGGSTEFCFKKGDDFISKSINVGSVRLKERFPAYSDSAGFIKKEISSLTGNEFSGSELIGVAGTLTTLSAVKNGLKKFDEDKIHKDVLTISDVKAIYENLSVMNNEDILSLGDYMKGRSDIIVYGTLILKEIMEYFSFVKVIVSTKGLRYGIFIDNYFR